ncbi:MAG: copper amine oxidase N-terminal domain-containing protein, partial [Desulfotomaculales bacterium]
MRKGILLAVLFLALVVVVAAPVWAAQFQVGKPVYWVNEAAHNMDVAPFIENGRTYVPVRYLAYALGVPEDGVFWNTRDQVVYLCAGDTGIFLVVGKPVLLVVRGRDAALLARLFQLQDLIEKKGKWAAIPALAQALQEFRELEEVLEMEDSDIKAWLKKRAEAVAMDVVPVIRKDRVFLPARFVAEAFGYEVAWRPAEQKVLLSPQGLSEAKEAGVDEATRPAAPVASGPPPVDEDFAAEYKYAGAQLVGVQGKHWFLSVSGGPTGGYAPQRLIITDPETGERRSYSAEAPEWKRDPVVIARPGLAD